MTLVDPTELLLPHRTAASWTSPRGLQTDQVPWRLWEKSKKLFWDPADIDFSADARDWAAMPEPYQIAIASLARGFMVGEESVTFDILPLVMAMSDEGRLEEVIFLTSFTLEEAKHVDFFRRWFSAVGADPNAFAQKAGERAIANGRPGYDPNRSVGIFESELPKVMRRLLVDRSPEAVLDASITYNQFVEGCLAISGYTIWSEMFASFGVLPGLQEGLRHIRADEGRHITYGTYLCQRVLAANPELIDFARARLAGLADWYFDAQGAPAQPSPQGADLADNWQGKFRALVLDQVTRRIAVMERAVQMTEAEMIAGAEAEEVERQLSNAN